MNNPNCCWREKSLGEICSKLSRSIDQGLLQCQEVNVFTNSQIDCYIPFFYTHCWQGVDVVSEESLQASHLMMKVKIWLHCEFWRSYRSVPLSNIWGSNVLVQICSLNSSSLASTCSCEPDNVNHHIFSTPEIWSPLWVFLLICNQSFAEFFACHLNIVPLTHLAVLFFTCHGVHWMMALSVSLCVCHDCCFVHVLVVFFIYFTCSTTSQQSVIQRIKEKSPFLKRNTEDKHSRRSTFRLS